MTDKVEVFKFEDKRAKIATIDLDMLSKSGSLRSATSNVPGPTRPLQSWELIRNIIEIANSNTPSCELAPIWVERKNALRLTTEEEETELGIDETNTPINKWVFNHVLTQININPEKAVKGYNPSIAVSFNQHGIQVVWGLNVHVCSNLSIFGENRISTYGPDRTPFNKQMDLLSYWMQNINQKFEEDLAIKESMTKTKLAPSQINEMIGDLYKLAIDKAYNKGKYAPFNTSILSNIVRNIETENISNVWDFYNVGTNVIKPGNFVLEEVFDTNVEWGKYLMSRIN
jgi:hypothetical protein